MKIAHFGWALVALVTVGCAPAADQNAPSNGPAAAVESAAPPLDLAALAPGDTIPGMPSWTRADFEILSAKVDWARQNKVDTLPIGQRVARIGETFVGAPYVPGTLDPAGSERMVIDLREFDCVTFVENMLALAHYVREYPASPTADPRAAMGAYQSMLERIRYRDGRLVEYPSRLHYFTDWLGDNERRGNLKVITKDLGGVVDAEPITFMSTHRESYKQLADSAYYREIGEAETRLNAVPRYFIPEEALAKVQDQIQDGDVLAMASTVKGLDVAHTGIAVWRNGELHLMNAPLVGKSVEVSEKNLPDRLAGIKSQDGAMVARPLEKPLLAEPN